MDLKWKLLLIILTLGVLIMALELPNKLFGQSDVRETEIAETQTKYWTCTGHNFVTETPTLKDYTYALVRGFVRADENNVSFVAPVFLPHGATITAVIVYGNTSAESYILRRTFLSSDTSSDVASGSVNFNTENTVLTNPIVDNANYAYRIFTTSLDNGDEIFGVRITYTI